MLISIYIFTTILTLSLLYIVYYVFSKKKKNDYLLIATIILTIVSVLMILLFGKLEDTKAKNHLTMQDYYQSQNESIESIHSIPWEIVAKSTDTEFMEDLEKEYRIDLEENECFRVALKKGDTDYFCLYYKEKYNPKKFKNEHELTYQVLNKYSIKSR